MQGSSARNLVDQCPAESKDCVSDREALGFVWVMKSYSSPSAAMPFGDDHQGHLMSRGEDVQGI